MKKILVSLLSLLLVLALAGIVSANSTIVLDDPVAAGADAIADSTESYIGSGSWANDSDGTKLWLWLPASLFGEDIQISEIAEISYHTLKENTQGGLNFYINIYTEPTDGGWYGSRLTLEPMYSHNFNDAVGAWVEWSTDAGTNQLTIFDQPRSGAYGWYYPPTLADIQAGPINWNDYLSTAPVTSIDYRGETIMAIVLDTGSGWDAFFEGNVDALTITLKDGTSVTIDLEVPPSTKAEILKGSGVPGKGLDTAPGLQKPFNPKSQAAEHAGKKK